MSSLHHLLSHARRYLRPFPKPHLHLHLQPQHFCTTSPPNPPNESPPITPVSYPLKPKQQQPLDTKTPNDSPIKPVSYAPKNPNESLEPRVWTREEARYLRDVTPIKPVSYSVKVAPLPEYNEVEEVEEVEKVEEVVVESVETNKDRYRREMQDRLRTMVRPEEEGVDMSVLEFPKLIKAEKRKLRVVMDLTDAIRELKANAAKSKRKFVETVEAHVRLGVDPKHGQQMVRGSTTLPHGTGKTVRVAVFADGAAADEARAAGADVVGGEELIEEIRIGGGSKLNFDKCISTPNFMPRLGKIGKILGPRNLMPNPKLGTVTTNVAEAVQDSKRGRIDFKVDKSAIVHVGLGKVNFSEESLRENISAFVYALLLAKPVGLKKSSKYAGYVNAFSLSSTMGPGIHVSIQSVSQAADTYSKLQQLK